MRKQTFFISFLAVFVVAFFIGSQAYASGLADYVNPETGYEAVLEDDAGLLTEEETEELGLVMESITFYGNVAFKTILENYDSADNYARSCFRSLFGQENGTLFLIDMDNRKLWIFSDGAMYKIITKDNANTITDNVYRYASREEYGKCAIEAFSQILSLLQGERIARPMKYISNAMLAVVMALLLNFGIVCFLTRIKKPADRELLQKMETSFSATAAAATFRYETKVYDPQSSGSGGGRSGGGGGSSSGGGGRSSGGGGGHSF